MKRIIIAIMALSLVLPGFSLAEPSPAQGAGQTPLATNTNAAPAVSPSQSDQAAQQQETRRRRSYERETRVRRHSGVSKPEKVFLVAIVGTSMGIGALAGGPKGLAIGAIVGGWGAFAGHKLWHWIR